MLHKIPSDFELTLTSAPPALKAWQDATSLARNEWICWTVTTKRPENRKNHIERTVGELQEGKRRPCCWAGCPHRSEKQ